MLDPLEAVKLQSKKMGHIVQFRVINLDVRGDVLGPPHGTTPAAVIANKKKLLDPLEAVKIQSKKMGHIVQFRVMNFHQ